MIRLKCLIPLKPLYSEWINDLFPCKISCHLLLITPFHMVPLLVPDVSFYPPESALVHRCGIILAGPGELFFAQLFFIGPMGKLAFYSANHICYTLIRAEPDQTMEMIDPAVDFAYFDAVFFSVLLDVFQGNCPHFTRQERIAPFCSPYGVYPDVNI